MKLLTKNVDYTETIELCKNMNESYDKSIIFHCYWNGQLNEKHLYSIKSCYYFNKKHKIVLWLEKNKENKFNKEIEKYAEIKIFDLEREKKNTFLEGKRFRFNKALSFYSDVVRYILLYKYGGCWFDLDVLFLRSFDPLFFNYEKDICVYQWESQNYPNGAIFICLEEKSEKMKRNIEFIMKRGKGWGFQEAKLTYDSDLDMLVLPCSWFDPGWLRTPYRLGPKNFFISSKIAEDNAISKGVSEEYLKIYKEKKIENFHKGAFCYHWHGKWNEEIHEDSIMNHLIKIIENNLE